MRVLLTGGHGMLGSSIAARWATRRPDDELLRPRHADLDLQDSASVAAYVAAQRPDAIVHAAAQVGGIAAKIAHPLMYLSDNLRIDDAVIGAALAAEVEEFLYIGSAAVYPETSAQPIPEAALLSGALEGANEGYALAKIAGIKECEYIAREYGFAYRSAIPSNLFGPGDHFAAGSAHLIAAALMKVDAARRSGAESVEVWGDGTARREFTYSGDLADWLVGQVGSLHVWPSILNLGVGTDHSIASYYRTAAATVGYDGDFAFDATKPSGAQQRLLDSSVARGLGWNPTTSIEVGMAAVYETYRTTLSMEENAQ